MSKKFGKFLLFSAVAGAAAYSTYYFLKAKDTAAPEKAEDVDDDFDDFSEDLDEDTATAKERSYVSLNLDKAEAFASEAFHKAKEVIVDSVQQVKDTVKAVKETQASPESNFTDLTALNKENESQEADSVEGSSNEEEAKAPETNTPAKEAPASSNAEAKPAASENSAAPETSDEKVEEFFDDDPLE